MFPINLNLNEKTVLLVGAGKVGRRKLEKILAAGAKVRLVEPMPDDEIKAMAQKGLLELFTSYNEQLLDGANLVFAASNFKELQQEIASAAKKRSVWVNIADAPALSDFILPAVAEEGLIQLSVSTTGGSPALSAKIAQEMREIYVPRYAELAKLMAKLRPLILDSELETKERKDLFKRLVNSKDLEGLLEKGQTEDILNCLKGLVKPFILPSTFTW